MSYNNEHKSSLKKCSSMRNLNSNGNSSQRGLGATLKKSHSVRFDEMVSVIPIDNSNYSISSFSSTTSPIHDDKETVENIMIENKSNHLNNSETCSEIQQNSSHGRGDIFEKSKLTPIPTGLSSSKSAPSSSQTTSVSTCSSNGTTNGNKPALPRLVLNSNSTIQSLAHLGNSLNKLTPTTGTTTGSTTSGSNSNNHSNNNCNNNVISLFYGNAPSIPIAGGKIGKQQPPSRSNTTTNTTSAISTTSNNTSNNTTIINNSNNRISPSFSSPPQKISVASVNFNSTTAISGRLKTSPSPISNSEQQQQKHQQHHHINKENNNNNKTIPVYVTTNSAYGSTNNAHQFNNRETQPTSINQNINYNHNHNTITTTTTSTIYNNNNVSAKNQTIDIHNNSNNNNNNNITKNKRPSSTSPQLTTTSTTSHQIKKPQFGRY